MSPLAPDEIAGYHASLLDTLDDAVVGTDAQFRVTVWNPAAQRIYGFSAEEVLGRHAREVGTFEGDLSRLELERELSVTGRSRMELTARRKDGSMVDVELNVVTMRDEHGEITGWLGIHRDVTERKATTRDLEQRARQQAKLAELGLHALAGDHLQATMDEAVALVAETLDAELTSVAEILPGGNELVLRAGVGWPSGAVGGMTSSAGRASLVGYTLVAGGPVVSEDLQADTRFTISPGLAREHPVSAASVVVGDRDDPYGTLSAFARTRRSFSGHEVNVLQSAANVIATAVERRRSESRLEEVRGHERSRLARDLNDEALDGLTRALQASERDGSDDLSAILQDVGRQLRHAIYDLRLDDAKRPFAEILCELVDVHRAMAPDISVTLGGQDVLPGRHFGTRGIEVLRVIGETLSNARRGGAATRISVRVAAADTRLSVEVADDGPGFDLDRVPAGLRTQGLQRIRERAELLDGRLDVHAEEHGTTVRLYVDLSPDSATKLTRVLLVEDHATFREALAAALERHDDIEVVGHAASLADARGQLEGVDVAVIDLGLPDGYGADLIRDLRRVDPRAQALVLTASADRADTARAVACGAAGVLDKTTHLDVVVGAIRRLRAGETLLSLGEIADLLRVAGDEREREHDDRAALALLTAREREILHALAEGLDSQRIASRMHISVRTVRNHIANVLAKLGVHSQIQALLFALRYGVVSVPSRSGTPGE
ncbi:MAG: hypothetical protein QOG15_3694 [Solirubrobacteraceae bacterium]|nr:hypothetical protein [Solirubrobacteraceae bacterium]